MPSYFLCACCLSVGATSSFALVNKVEQCACFGVKNIGKPYALIAHVRMCVQQGWRVQQETDLPGKESEAP